MPSPLNKEKIRVLIVDDSMVVRRAVSEALRPDQEIDVIGTAANGKIALEKIPELKPDVLILDIEMPVCDGFEVLQAIRKQRIGVRTIMFSTLTERGASQTIKALSLGASDYVAKPTSGSITNGYQAGLKQVASELTPKIKQFKKRVPFGRSARTNFTPSKRTVSAAPVSRPVATMRRGAQFSPQIIAIGISTGGPEALAKLLPAISPSLPVPIVLVQHMPPLFTKLLAERLNASSRIKVVEAAEGMALEPGVAYIAPGNYHLIVKSLGSRVTLSVNQEPTENSCRPAADVLFRSVAKVYGKRSLGVIMTGMGQDGLKGLRIMRAAGAAVIAQDEASSVVWGMPAAVVHEGLADKVLHLDQLSVAIEKSVGQAASVAVHAR